MIFMHGGLPYPRVTSQVLHQEKHTNITLAMSWSAVQAKLDMLQKMHPWHCHNMSLHFSYRPRPYMIAGTYSGRSMNV